MKARANCWTGHGVQTVVFPEGSTTNGSVLLEFKSGVFRSGSPVQPFVMKAPNNAVNWPWEAINPIKHVLRLLLQFRNRAELTVLPVYIPREAEKADPELYASNVRVEIAKAGGFGLADGYRVREELLWHKFMRFGVIDEAEYLAARDKMREGKLPSPPVISAPPS